MKKVLLAIIIFWLCGINVQAKEISHYMELARTFGIVRYFSPNPYVQDWSESDWMKVCALLVNRAETQPLETVFKPLAPTLSFSNLPSPSIKNTIVANNPTYCNYYSGSGKLNIPFLAKLFMPGLSDYVPYYQKLLPAQTFQDSIRMPLSCKYYSYPISKERFLNIQHALAKTVFDKKGTQLLLAEAKNYWKNHESKDKSLSKKRQFILGLLSDKYIRIADLVVRWNIIRHFYPYYQDDNLNWDRQLENYLCIALQMKDINTIEGLLDWYNVICNFFNPVKDGHLFVQRDIEISKMVSTYLPEYFAPIETKVINDTLLIRNPSNRNPSWCILRSINGQAASEFLQHYRQTTNAATKSHQDKMAVEKLLSSIIFNTSFVTESHDISGHTFRDTLYARNSEPLIAKHNSQLICKQENGILYIDATSPEMNEKKFLAAITTDVREICFDLRGLPSYKFEDILAHLISSDIAAPTAEIPQNCFPFQRNSSWRKNVETLKAKLPYVKLPIKFLCDASTVSWGETILMMVQHYKLGKIVGCATAGTDGDMTFFDLPIFPFSMTGMRMRCMNGDKHHGRGIIPDKTITVYAKDYIENFDRILHTALKY